MKTIPGIIKSFGSIVAFAEATGICYGTAKTMSRRKSIAAHHWPGIVKAAEKRGIAGVTLEAFAKIRVRQAKERAT